MRRAGRSPADPYELLLDGVLGDDALSRVLAAVTAAGTPDELAGLPVARSAFVVEQTSTAAPARAATAHGRPAATRTVAGRLLAAKAVAAVSGVTLIGGVAYAATSTTMFRSPPPHHAPSTPTDLPNQGGGGDGNSTPDLPRGGNGPASAAPVRPKTSRSVTPPGYAHRHTRGGPASAHGTPRNTPTPAHQPGVGSTPTSAASRQTKSPRPHPSHPAHPTRAPRAGA